MIAKALKVLLAAVMVAGCSKGPYYATNKQYTRQAKQFAKTIQQPPAAPGAANGEWIGTTNFNLRKPNLVIIHHTAMGSCQLTVKAFTLVKSQVSAHYLICKDGTVHHLLNDYLRAWHAGVGKWGSVSDINSASIGIELDNNGKEPFPQPQINSLFTLLDTLKTKYAIPTANFIGHADVAPTRKDDPNIYFPWKSLAEKGYGNWFGDTTNVSVPENLSVVQSLRIVGYDVKDSVAAIKAFKRHFLQDTALLVTEADKKVLYDLMKKNL